MIININAENFKSFNQRLDFSMVQSAKIQTLPEHKVKKKNVTLLKNAAIYGANSSGKSNLIEIVTFMQFVLKNGLPVGVELYCKNKEENKDKNSVFELQIEINGKCYAYGFEARLSALSIEKEWLYELHANGEITEVFTFVRGSKPQNANKDKYTMSDKQRWEVYAQDFVADGSRLFLAAMNRGQKYEIESKLIVLQEVYSFIVKDIIVLNQMNEHPMLNEIGEPTNKNEIEDLLRHFDTGIDYVTEEDCSLDEFRKSIPIDLFQRINEDAMSQLATKKVDTVYVTVESDIKYYTLIFKRGGNVAVKVIRLVHKNAYYNFEYSEESSGTQRLFCLLPMLLKKTKDKVYIIDELERSFHPGLTKQFVSDFNRIHQNDSSQLIFTTHETAIMTQELFRRDEIWFVDKDESNCSRLYSLDRFKERFDKVISKSYLDGRYNAVPVFNEIKLEG